MTQVMILLAALSSYHSTPEKCEEVTNVLLSTMSYGLVYGKEYRNRKVSIDIKAVDSFYESCKKKKRSR